MVETRNSSIAPPVQKFEVPIMYISLAAANGDVSEPDERDTGADTGTPST